ncbi:membrane protein insertase YidC [Bacillus sp. RO3]|nr:membrane protein insertase YidC [Bacillus sp. RO3]
MKNISFILIFVLLTLSGCQSATADGAFFHDYLVHPFSFLIHEIGTYLGGNFGLAIMIITLLIRIVLFPFMLKTYKAQQEMRGKMANLKPEMGEIQEKMKEAKTKDEQMHLQHEMMMVYRKHEVNPLSTGCLPFLFQTPILIGLYYAIRSSSEIASHSFLWFHLGQPDFSMAVIAGLVYLVQARTALMTIPADQVTQMKGISYLSPIMIFIFSFNAPAALPLYWTVGGAFLILQTVIGKNLYHQPKGLKKQESQ